MIFRLLSRPADRDPASHSRHALISCRLANCRITPSPLSVSPAMVHATCLMCPQPRPTWHRAEGCVTVVLVFVLCIEPFGLMYSEHERVVCNQRIHLPCMILVAHCTSATSKYTWSEEPAKSTCSIFALFQRPCISCGRQQKSSQASTHTQASSAFAQTISSTHAAALGFELAPSHPSSRLNDGLEEVAAGCKKAAGQAAAARPGRRPRAHGCHCAPTADSLRHGLRSRSGCAVERPMQQQEGRQPWR